MLLNKNMLSVAYAVSDVDTREIFKYVEVKQDNNRVTITGTDGRIAVRKTTYLLPDEDYPITEGLTQSNEKLNTCLLNGKELVKIIKDVPKHKSLNILNNVMIDNEQTNKKDNAPIFINNLESIKKHNISKIISKFANVDQVIPNEEPINIVKLNINVLRKLLKSIPEAEDITLSFYEGKHVPIKIDSKFDDIEIMGLIMPIPLD